MNRVIHLNHGAQTLALCFYKADRISFAFKQDKHFLLLLLNDVEQFLLFFNDFALQIFPIELSPCESSQCLTIDLCGFRKSLILFSHKEGLALRSNR